MPELLDPIEQILCKTEEATKKQICVGKSLPSVIFETIKTLGNTEYAIYAELPDNNWELRTEATFDNYVPMPADKNPLTTPHAPLEYESEEALWNDVRAFIYKHLDLINPKGYHVLTAWVFSTWVAELFDFTAYLGFLGREAVGKTRALEVLNELCFRAWFTTGLTTATLFRLVERFNPTLLLDEAEFLNTQERKELINLLNAGQRRGLMIPRMTGEHYDDVELFGVYCPKAISGTERLKKTTRSRMITFNMTKNTRPVPKTIDKQEGAMLRSKLLMWRFHKLSRLRSNLSLKERIALSEEVKATTEFPELEPFSGRSYELIYPLMYVAPTPHARKTITDFATELEHAKTREEKTQLSNLVFEAITKLEPRATRGLIHLRDITAYVNSTLDIEYQYGSKTVGKIAAQMGFEKTRTSRGIAIIIDQHLMQRLRKDPRYAT
jgi:hypothetical protein